MQARRVRYPELPWDSCPSKINLCDLCPARIEYAKRCGRGVPCGEKDCFGETPKPALETSALPEIALERLPFNDRHSGSTFAILLR
jgi:hypothetical protein